MAHTAPAPASFEEAVSRLETLIRDMESGQLPLEASLAAYQQGSELIRFCQARLAQAEQQLSVLENGELKPLTLEGADV
ncbi:exodeoxyribonuclease VII small subunit [Rivihabitans pingtungensis]|jgi:exodeoxyribonuclease VII small subunit|uniref:Exodeoxyribonuclease 7 small subunit n=1 Tax=Rivihabitans pingtungensis TaxID=1054498 RepID=A0A318L1T6_9NEIS|nr:exodeoxyribonuclease VII small subunit [Rivihabitans pingtungensis]MCK6436020.1 exodeoxyribonuclease VII small subunit [Rivihabitans pingtungensis]PXX81916.1 exodeoxyribonuclease VII small subunit [Rivihabitans pingtungensis]HNX71925.1 exodeoxyribonuclease VII small subunit [Rivihabitans pingtungensis]